MASGYEDDYWTGSGPTIPTDNDSATSSVLKVQRLGCVEPLGSQLGVIEPITVPAALRAPLFGQSDLLTAGCDSLPLHTYAILDAAKVPLLPEMLGISGLDYACLFKGEAAEELRNVAPYLVRLEEGHVFTRRLFSNGEAGWQMWDKEPGIFIRAQVGLDELRKNFRKFTKISTDAGSMEYFRFWEGAVLDYIAFFDGSDLGYKIFPNMHIIWKSYYYNREPRFTLMRIGNFQ